MADVWVIFDNDGPLHVQSSESEAVELNQGRGPIERYAPYSELAELRAEDERLKVRVSTLEKLIDEVVFSADSFDEGDSFTVAMLLHDINELKRVRDNA